MLSVLRAFSTATLLAAFVACGGTDATKPTTGNMGPAGGSLSFAGGLIVITFPQGAVASETTFTATPLTTGYPANALLVTGTVYSITPSYTFAHPVTIALKVGSGLLPNGVLTSELRVNKVVSNAWQALPGQTYDAGTQTLTATTTTFSTFGLVGVGVGSVQVAPGNDTITVDSAFGLTATVKDSDSNVLPSRPVTWSSSDTTKAKVSSSGVVSGKGVGSATITATSGGISGHVTVVVKSSGAPTPWLAEDFSTYTSTSNMISDPRHIYSDGEDVNTGQMTLDTTVGYGGLTQSMRYDYADRTSVGGSGLTGRCTDYVIGRALVLPTTTQEIWAEFYVKFTVGFTTVAPSVWGCTSNPDLKLIFGRTHPDNRYEVKAGNSTLEEWVWRWPGGPETNVPAAQFPPANVFNDTWMQIRVHFKNSTTATSHDGAYAFWLNGVVVKDTTGVNTIANDGVSQITDLYGIWLGQNLNQGPAALQSLWWGRVRVYNSDPGW